MSNALNLLGSYGDDSSQEETDETAMRIEEEKQEAPNSRDVVESLLGRLLQDLKLPPPQAMRYRADHDDEDDRDSSDSSSSDDSSSSSGSASDDELEESQPSASKKTQNNNQSSKTKGEKKFELPPIEDLHISVPSAECLHLGEVASCVDDQVVVRSFPYSAAIDLDSVLFLDEGRRPLGRVFDVFGPVTQPFYSVRFNSAEHIREKSVVTGQAVYCAPKKTEYTSYVFVEQLRRLKGSDASWKHDEEPPVRFVEYSDDDEERAVKKGAKKATAAKGASATAQAQVPSKKPCYRQPDAYSQHNNVFYRRQRRYDPRQNGPITWNSVRQPPPPPHSATYYPHYHGAAQNYPPPHPGMAYGMPPQSQPPPPPGHFAVQPNYTQRPPPPPPQSMPPTNPFGVPPPSMSYSNHQFGYPQ